MKKFMTIAKRNLLVLSIVFAVIFLGIRFILHLFDMEYRQWIFYTAAGLFIIGTIAGLVPLIQKIKNDRYRNTCKAILFLTSLPVFFYLFFFASTKFMPERVEIINGQKVLVQEQSFIHSQSDYHYRYINPFVQGKSVESIDPQ